MPHDTEPTTSLLPVPVAVLRWPAQDRERRRLAALGRPRVLLTGLDIAPPSLLDDRELWVAHAGDARSLADAMEFLGREAGPARGRPLLDEDGRLRHDGRWVDITPSQVGVVEVLVADYRRLVPMERLREAHRRAGRIVSASAITALVQRLDTRVSPIGLRVRHVRRRGAMLCPNA
jgi:hypothetical protein